MKHSCMSGGYNGYYYTFDSIEKKTVLHKFYQFKLNNNKTILQDGSQNKKKNNET